MSFSVEQFDTLVAQAEDAAAGFDGGRITGAIEDLNAFMQSMVHEANRDPKQLIYIRERLERYQRLCAFLQETLHQVLMGALRKGEPSCYTSLTGRTALSAPPGANEIHLAPLIRRYC
jgi:hypothetical protein